MSSSSQSIRFSFALFLLLVVPATAVLAGSEVNLGTGLTLAGPPLALRGYDPVAYFTDGKAALGSAEYSLDHNGAAYRFTSRAHLKSFKSHPEKYLPQFGGFCAFGASVNAKFDGDPHLWKIVDGKLYFNLNEKIQQSWVKDLAGNIAKAEKNWPGIRDKSPASLK